jgi:hypothetical protein
MVPTPNPPLRRMRPDRPYETAEKRCLPLYRPLLLLIPGDRHEARPDPGSPEPDGPDRA